MKKKENIETIYEAALSVYAEYGFRKSTLDDIARKLGMTKSNLYRYARNKNALYRDTVAWALLRWQQYVGDAIEKETDVRQQFRTMCFKAVEYLSRDDAFRRVLIHDPDIFPMFPVQDPFHDINRNSVLMIKSLLERGILEKTFRPVDPDKVSEIIFSIYKMFIIRTYIKMENDHMQSAFAETFELMVNGLYEK